jgi:hypothetical protein
MKDLKFSSKSSGQNVFIGVTGQHQCLGIMIWDMNKGQGNMLTGQLVLGIWTMISEIYSVCGKMRMV